jgi:acyl-CoA synthetase (AMP-forming)/AMP-acid ligase II
MLTPDNVTARLRNLLDNPPERDLLEYEGHWWTCAQVAAVGKGIGALLDAAGVPRDVAIGVVIQNHPETAAALIGLIALGRPITMVYSHQANVLIAANVRKLDLAVVIAEERDWSDELRSCLDGDRLGISLPAGLGSPTVVKAADRLLENCRRHPEVVVEVLTSGTTGAPKNVALSLSALSRGIGALVQGVEAAEEPQVELVYVPLASIGGILMVLSYAAAGARFCLFERFKVEQWADAVRRHGPATTGVTAPVIRSILEKQIDPDWLKSLRCVFGGAGPLETEFRQKFRDIYGIDVCWGYGATEFAGTLATWTPQLKAELGEDRLHSVGRVVPGLNVRITDPETGEAVPKGETGRLEALIPNVAEDWIRTNDLAKFDEDDILYIFGRLDGAINRGGFKVLPEIVVDALRRHPAVSDAAVIGLPDSRLGEIPVALVELKADAEKVTPEELREFARGHLPSPSVPAQIRIIDELPRNTMLKVDIAAVRKLWAENAETSPASAG